MVPRHLIGPTLTLLLLAAAAAAQVAGEPPRDQPKQTTAIPSAGFWPTPKMLDRLIDRMTEQMAEHYDFDEEQLRLTREVIKARLPEFLNKNRAEIQTLMNQYFEALLDDKPPSVEAVADWAQRLQPLLEEFGGVAHDITDDMAQFLTEEQQDLLSAEMTSFDTGLRMAQAKLSVWASGGYDPQTEWIHPAAETPDGKDARRADAEQKNPDKNADDAAEANPKDEWAIYTERFIRKYRLNDEQQQKAYAFLRRQQEARDKYLRRKSAEMERITRMLEDAETEAQRKTALAAYKKINAPIERMFQSLKDRLDTLPTRAQRRAAAARAPASAPAQSAPAPQPAQNGTATDSP